jgi:hypothetical protein
MVLLMLFGLPGAIGAACKGDINLDGKVDGLDYAIMNSEMGRNDCAAHSCKADINSDGVVDQKDKDTLQSEFGRKDCQSEKIEMTEDGGGNPRVVPGEVNMKEGQPEALPAKGPEGLQEDLAVSAAGDEKPKTEETSTSQSVRFKDNGDGTVIDSDTGLMWTKNANLPGDKMLFYEAEDYIQEMNRGDVPNFGHTDWRLPELEELRSLVDYTRYTNMGHELPVGHPFENVQLLRFGDFAAGSIYFWTTKASGFFSLYCRIVGYNVNSCAGFVWPVRYGK